MTNQFNSNDLLLDTPTNLFACLKGESGYSIGLYIKKGNDYSLVADSKTPFSILLPGKELVLPQIDSATLSGGKLRFTSNLKDQWKAEGEVSPEKWDDTHYFVEHVTFSYLGERPLSVSLLKSTFLLGPTKPPIWFLPSALNLLNGKKHPCHPVHNGFVSALEKGRFNIRARFCSTPLFYFYWPGCSYGLSTMPYYGEVLTGFDYKEEAGRISTGVTYPYMEPEAYKDHAPGLEVKPGDTFSWDLIHFLDDSSNPHEYGQYQKIWYDRNGEYGDYNRWTSSSQTLRLLRKGFLIHYDEELAILHDAIGYDGTYLFPHRGMTNGWASGASSAYHMLMLGHHLEDNDLIDKARKVLNNISSHLTPSGFYYGEFDEIEKRWSPSLTWWETAMAEAFRKEMPGIKAYPGGKIPATPISETTYFMFKSYLFSKSKGEDEKGWLDSAVSNLDTLCRVAPDGVFGQYYEPETGEIIKERTFLNTPESLDMDWVAALSLGHRITGESLYLNVAEKAAAYYRATFLDKIVILPSDCPCDASEPMAESSNHALRGYWELYAVSGKEKWLRVAVDAAHSVLSWRIAFNIKMPKGSEFERYNYKSIGMDHAVEGSHLYGCMNAIHLLRIWQETRDSYFLERAIDTIQCSCQFISRSDGEFQGKAGMLPEGVDHYEGRVHPISHVGPMGWVTCAILCCQKEFGGIVVDFYNYTAGAIQFLDLEKIERKENGMEFTVFNPWTEKISTTVSVYFCDRELSVKQDGKERPAFRRASRVQAEIEIPETSRTVIEILSQGAGSDDK